MTVFCPIGAPPFFPKSALLHDLPIARRAFAGYTSVIVMTGTTVLPGFSCAEVLYPKGEYHHPASDLLQIRVLREGSSSAVVDLGAGRRSVFTRPGDILLSLPDRATYFRIESGRNLTLLQVETATANALLALDEEATVADLAPLLEKPIRDPMITELCRRISERGDPGAPFCRSAIVVVLHALLSRAREVSARPAAPSLSRRDLVRLTAFVDARLDQKLSAKALADEVNVSPKAFARAFPAAAGLPVYQFILNRRAQMAVTLLRETQLPMAEIALRAGFAHQSHMTRTVRRLRGETPKQIRSGAMKGSSRTP